MMINSEVRLKCEKKPCNKFEAGFQSFTLKFYDPINTFSYADHLPMICLSFTQPVINLKLYSNPALSCW